MQRKIVVNAIVTGIQKANKTYEKWTDGGWLHDGGVENLMSVKIADTIYEKALNENGNKNETLALEVLFSQIEEHSQCDTKPGAKPKVLQANHRADLVLFHANWCPAAAIEVKRKWEYKSCNRDLERLIALLKRHGKHSNGSLKFTCLAVFLAFKSEDKLHTKYEEIEGFVGEITGNASFDFSYEVKYLPSEQYEDFDNPWFSGGVVISFWS